MFFTLVCQFLTAQCRRGREDYSRALGVENQLHWVLDVVFREDALKVTDPDGAKHLALFNRAALSAIRQHQGKKDSLAGKRRRAG
ncbi:hypothetical protein TUM3811_13140 [Shewanella algae]|nr:hypothetical protein TUM3811_13140 [Shewanella algae]